MLDAVGLGGLGRVVGRGLVESCRAVAARWSVGVGCLLMGGGSTRVVVGVRPCHRSTEKAQYGVAR